MNAEEFPVVLFSSKNGDVRVNAVLRDKTLWLTQKSMSGLFGVKSQAITKHLKNIYATGELQITATCSKMEQVQSEGGRSVSRMKADEKAHAEYDEFNRHQQIESDFDRQIKLLLDGGNA